MLDGQRWERGSRRFETATGEVRGLAYRHAELHRAHERLKISIRQRVHRALVEETAVAANTKNFAETSMGTIAGWITAQTFYVGISDLLSLSSIAAMWKPLVARLIYAAFVSVTVPLLDLQLRAVSRDEQTHFVADQARLVRVCLPMLYAWAWRDVVNTALQMGEGDLWPVVVVVGLMTGLLVCVQMTPTYRRAWKAVSERGPGDTPAARMVVSLGHMGLAVGFAWNFLASWGPRRAMKLVREPMLAFMIQSMYYLAVTCCIVFVTSRWGVEGEAVGNRAGPAAASAETSAELEIEALEKAAAGQARALQVETEEGMEQPRQTAGRSPRWAVEEQDAVVGLPLGHSEVRPEADVELQHEETPMELVVEMIEDIIGDLRDVGRGVTLSALHFVYAWAQLDTLNALVFTYLLGCDGPGSCHYSYNFFFALGVTIIFAKISALMKLEKRRTAWNKASVALATRAFSLNTGWAWANYCMTAVGSAQSHQVLRPIWMYLISTAFAWVCITFLHRKFEVERRAWDRHCKEEARAYELSLG